MGFENKQCSGQSNMQRQLVPVFGGYNYKGAISSML